MGQGLKPGDAAERAVNSLNNKLIKRRGHAGDISVVCMNNKGEWGVGTNYVKATQEWIDTHREE